MLFLPLAPALGVFAVQFYSGTVPRLRIPMPTVLATVAQRWERPLWVDARSREAYEEGHKEGAVWLNEGSWQEGLPMVLDEWSPGRRVVVYCSSQSCQESQAVARRLMEETGWPDIFVLAGGWEQLKGLK